MLSFSTEVDGMRREYVVNMRKCATVMVPFFGGGWEISWVPETTKRICCEYVGNVPVSWILFFWMWVRNFVGTGDN